MRLSDKLLWFALAATGSVVLLATTNQMCRNVPVVPFLWVLPLSLYLLTFVLCFQNERGYRRGIWIPAMLASSALATFLLPRTTDMDIRLQILIYSFALFSCCMVCHGELARAKPSPDRLTVFYLMTAGGGAAGGVFVGLLTPLWFNDYWEFYLALLACYFIAALPLWGGSQGGPRRWTTHFLRLAWTVGATLGVIIWLRSVNYEAPGTLATARNFFGVLAGGRKRRRNTSWAETSLARGYRSRIAVLEQSSWALADTLLRFSLRGGSCPRESSAT